MTIAAAGRICVGGASAPGLVLFAAGMALAGTPATAITASLPPSKQGVASAVNDTARELGSALGIAILGSVLNQQYRDTMAEAVKGLPAQVAEGAQRSIAFTQSPALAQLGDAGRRLVDAAQQAFVDGISGAVLTAAIVLVLAAVAVALRSPRPTPTTQPRRPAPTPPWTPQPTAPTPANENRSACSRFRLSRRRRGSPGVLSRPGSRGRAGGVAGVGDEARAIGR